MKQKKLDTKVNHHQQQQQQKEEEEDQDKIEILKAVAQAWHARSTACRSANESDASRRSFLARPSRFKLEAVAKSSAKAAGVSWDFKQSLWDSYEIVAVSKRLERGLVSDYPVSGSGDDQGQRVRRRRKESKNSLRSLFNHISSRRFSEVAAPPDDTNDDTNRAY